MRLSLTLVVTAVLLTLASCMKQERSKTFNAPQLFLLLPEDGAEVGAEEGVRILIKGLSTDRLGAIKYSITDAETGEILATYTAKESSGLREYTIDKVYHFDVSAKRSLVITSQMNHPLFDIERAAYFTIFR